MIAPVPTNEPFASRARTRRRGEVGGRDEPDETAAAVVIAEPSPKRSSPAESHTPSRASTGAPSTRPPAPTASAAPSVSGSGLGAPRHSVIWPRESARSTASRFALDAPRGRSRSSTPASAPPAPRPAAAAIVSACSSVVPTSSACVSASSDA